LKNALALSACVFENSLLRGSLEFEAYFVYSMMAILGIEFINTG
jgi:hypothetical protein